MTGKRISILGLVLALAVSFTAAAELKLHPLFTDHMVLQQGMNVPVWGMASPGEKVQVSINGAEESAKADESGKWKVELPKLKANSGPWVMSIQGESESIMLQDVLVGDVWVCSGQSNMQWSLERAMNPDEEIAASTHPKLRLYYVPRETADTPQDSVEAVWTPCNPETSREFSAVAYFFGRSLQEMGSGPIGLIHTSWGGTPVEAWTERSVLEAMPEALPILERWDRIVADYPQTLAAHEAKVTEWEEKAAEAKAAGQEEPQRPRAPQGPDHPHRPESLYNGMIHPLLPYAIKGAIWYQGESNAPRAYQYQTLFPAMIENWRDVWNQGPFPFLFVQLANYEARQQEPNASDWAELREAQTMALELKNTGMAVTIDIGNPKDIHPKNKQEVGRRLALAAQNVAYGNKKVAFSGPLFKRATFSDGEATLRFDHTDEGLVTKDGASLQGFALAGADRNFVAADAVIKGKNVVVTSSDVPKPVAVRYSWADDPDGNLYNGAGLPASPFRSDDWPGLTFEAR